jgi:hypothetical protein
VIVYYYLTVSIEYPPHVLAAVQVTESALAESYLYAEVSYLPVVVGTKIVM